MNESEFLEKLKEKPEIKCNKRNIMDGKLIYEVIDIVGAEAICLRYFRKHEWMYRFGFADIERLYQYYKYGWIELRGVK